jgi:hypothetical protein
MLYSSGYINNCYSEIVNGASVSDGVEVAALGPRYQIRDAICTREPTGRLRRTRGFFIGVAFDDADEDVDDEVATAGVNDDKIGIDDDDGERAVALAATAVVDTDGGVLVDDDDEGNNGA